MKLIEATKIAVGYDGSKRIFYWCFEGEVSREIRGENGFGWDPIFIPKGSSMTFAEMDPVEKDKISHRGRALVKFKDFLKANYDI
jgi:XTP/dITP diphosphohydrolase